jgi:transcriptional regulator with XRE-family HTH domain
MPKRTRDLPEEYASNWRTLARAIGARVRLRRSVLDLTQEQLRARLEFEQVYISRTQFSRIENGQAMPDAFELLGLHATLGVTFDWLVRGEGKPE